MKILTTVIIVGVAGLISLVVTCYFSPQIFLKTTYILVKQEFPGLPKFSNQSLHRLSVDERADYVLVDVCTPQERSNWRIIGKGHGIHWENLDEDIKIEGLLVGVPSGESQSSFKKWLEARQGGYA